MQNCHTSSIWGSLKAVCWLSVDEIRSVKLLFLLYLSGMGSKLRLPIFFGIAFAMAVFGFAKTAQAGVIHNVDGWAWNGQLGWISMNCEDPKPGFPSGDCSAANGNYGLDIDAAGNLSGWAWSSEGGWICFGSTCDGAAGVPAGGTPTEDHYCPSHAPCALYDPSDGEFHGWAYIVGNTDASSFRGWMTLNCTDVDPNTASPHSCGVDYAVGFDEGASGGDAQFYGYSWNGNADGTGVGWTQFACAQTRPCAGLDWGVTSGWVNSGWVTLKQQEGVYSPTGTSPGAGSYLTDIPMIFTDFSAPEDSTLRCSVKQSDGTYFDVLWSITDRQVLVPEYDPGSPIAIAPAAPVTDASGNPVLWSFSTEPPEAPFGCEIQGTPPLAKAVSNLVAVHASLFDFTGPGGPVGSDSNRAKYCLDGNLGALDPSRAYFLNTVQCDTEGDLAFTLLKSKGVEVELICDDDIDDDGNLQKDCDGGLVPTLEPDRNCRGITYLCIAHPPAPSTDPPLP